MRHIALAVVLVVGTCCAGVHATADPAAVKAMLDRLLAADGAILGASVSSVDSTGIRMDAGASAGYSRADQTQDMGPNIAVRGGTIGELLLSSLAVDLITQLVLPQLDESIPSRLLPGGLTFVNPNFPGQPLTMRMLLTHTSSIQDTVRFDQNPALVSSGSTADSLQNFANTYFLTTASGSPTVVQDIWTTDQPGLAASYRFARTNIALMAYVVQLAMADNVQLATVPTVGGLIQERVMGPLGMTGTYFMLPDGRSPFIQTALTNIAATKQVEPTTFPIHAAYVADYMCLTTSSDLVKLMNSLFIQSSGTLRTVGALMAGSFIELAEVDRTRGLIQEQGFGVVAFEHGHLCNVWRAGGGSGLSCPFSPTRRAWGYATSSEAATLAVVCQNDPVSVDTTTTAQNTAAQVSCASATMTRSATSSSRVSLNQVLAAVGEAHRQLQSTTLNAAAGFDPVFPSDQQRDAAYGFGVFAAVVVIIFFIVLVSYLTEFIVRPISVTGNVVSTAYPKLDDVMADEDDEASPLRLGAPQ